MQEIVRQLSKVACASESKYCHTSRWFERWRKGMTRSVGKSASGAVCCPLHRPWHTRFVSLPSLDPPLLPSRRVCPLTSLVHSRLFVLGFLSLCLVTMHLDSKQEINVKGSEFQKKPHINRHYTIEDVPLVEFMYLVFTRMPGESYRRRLGSLLYSCSIFRALINSLVCWLCTSALGLFCFRFM